MEVVFLEDEGKTALRGRFSSQGLCAQPKCGPPRSLGAHCDTQQGPQAGGRGASVSHPLGLRLPAEGRAGCPPQATAVIGSQARYLGDR